MAQAKNDLLTAGNIAKMLGVSGGQVKKAIDTLRLAPDAKKGPCNYYGATSVSRIKAALK